ncbi:MAG: hypothetical protein RLZZ352_1936 [Pseudomonadota bacterium]|jgi:protein TonB
MPTSATLHPMRRVPLDNPRLSHATAHRFAHHFAPLTHLLAAMDRRYAIVIAVVALHVLGLWALQAGLLQRAVELVVPVQILADWVEAPQPPVEPTPPAPQQPRPAPPTRAEPTPAVAAPAPPVPLLATPADITPPEPKAPIGTVEPPAAPAVVAAPVSKPTEVKTPSPAVSQSAPTPPKVELPSSQADYLNNPPPAYPALSKRLGEQGKVVLRVFIEADGRATQAEIRSSSGYDRLDQTAMQTVLRWRYVPGKRNGVAEAMWYVVPIQFVLD